MSKDGLVCDRVSFNKDHSVFDYYYNIIEPILGREHIQCRTK